MGMLGHIDPDLVTVRMLDDAAPFDEYATQAVATPDYLPDAKIVGQLDTPRPDLREQLEGGAVDRSRRTLTVRKRDWKAKDTRAQKGPRPGDRVVAHRKKYALTAETTAVDLFVESVEEAASGMGSFAAWVIHLTDRKPE
jgi:hypothetical protein